MTRAKEQDKTNHYQEIKQSAEQDPEIIQMLALLDRVLKITRINMLNNLIE